ncbi:MAG: hypothetical protein PVJ15_05985 [Gammaproteobacteria bacterium]
MKISSRPFLPGILRGILASLLLVLPLAPFADEAVPKSIFLVNEDDRVFASNIQTGQFFELDLQAKEEILEQYVANGVALVVTNQRYIAIGIYPIGWSDLDRVAGEKLVSAEVEDYAALVVTTDRILSFNGKIGSWSQTKR